MRRLACLFCLLLAGLGVAACGSTEDDNAYVARLNAAQATFARDFEAVTAKTGATATTSESQQLLAQYRSVVRDAVEALQLSEPPDRVKGLHDQLLAAFRRYDAEIGRFRRDIAASDRAKAERAQVSFNEQVLAIGEQVNTAIRAINGELRG